jgi:class 3 adenylate cyclase
MEPEIRYCATRDGVSIAYWSMGEGAPVVDAGHPPTHLLMEWRMAPVAAWYARFLRNHQYVRFDTRGTGLSDREIDAYSLETVVCDLEAVADALRLERFTLIGGMNSGAPAIAYAAQHPDRVLNLVLWCAYPRGRGFFDESGTRALRDMIDRNWPMMVDTAIRSRFDWGADEHAREYATMWRAAIAPGTQAMLMDGLRELDVLPLLAQVQCPTLVLQREGRGPGVARQIAAGITQSSLVLFPGGSAAPYLDDADDVWAAIARFLGDDPSPEAPARRPAAVALRTVMFTDVVKNTPLLQRIGDAAWRDVMREHEAIVRGALAAHGGDEISTAGDSFFASFSSATAALECAIEMQRSFAERNAAAAHPFEVRVGLNAGEPIADGNDLVGTAVSMAARIMGCAEGGEVLVSDVVRQLVAGKGFLFTDRGETVLRGFDDPVRLYAVRLPGGH